MPQPKPPLGRATIRKGLLGDQPSSRVVGLWTWDAKPGSTLKKLRGAYLTGLNSVDNFDSRRTTLEKDIRFTPEGRREQLFEYAVKDLAPALKRGRNIVERAKQDVAERRAKLKPPTADKTDIAAALLRREIRDRIGQMDSQKQAEFFASHGANLDQNISLAILEVPQELGIVSPTQRERLLDRHMREQGGTELDDIAELEKAIARAEASVEQSRDLIQVEAAAGDRAKFDQAAAPFEKSAATVWLRKIGDEVRVVDLERKVSRKANQEELESGIFYESYEAYAAASGITAAQPATDAA